MKFVKLKSSIREAADIKAVERVAHGLDVESGCRWGEVGTAVVVR